MAKCYPETIPDTYKFNERLSDAYKRGWNHGHGIACHNVPKLGSTVWTDAEGKLFVEPDNIREVHSLICYASADNARCYSPFEFTAKEFNDFGQEERSEEELFEERANDKCGAHRCEAGKLCSCRRWAQDRTGECFISSDQLWEAFEEGTADAIAADIAEYTNEDYGIPLTCFTLRIDTENAAFEDRNAELARILRELASALERGNVGDNGAVRDHNGNTCGQWEFAEEERD